MNIEDKLPKAEEVLREEFGEELNQLFSPYDLDKLEKAIRHYTKRVLDVADKSVKIKYTSCGDPFTCGCQGTCDHPIAYIDCSILKIKELLK